MKQPHWPGSPDEPEHITARRLIEAHDEAAAFYRECLERPEGTSPRDYLRHRRVADALDDPRWTIGYAPRSWTALAQRLRMAGFADNELLRSGLTIATRQGTLVDRFRDRITFGIHNDLGELVAFTARAAPGATGVPKYLNSPATAIYRKSTVLFGLAEQAAQLDNGSIPVVVEGPFDALAVTIASPNHAGIAVCGTAVSPYQADLLSAQTDGKIIVALDPDDPGATASTTIASRLNTAGLGPLLTPRSPLGADLAEVMQSDGPEEVRLRLSNPEPLSGALVRHQLEAHPAWHDNAEARIAALRRAARLLLRIGEPDLATQATQLSRRLQLSQKTVNRELIHAATTRPDQHRPSLTATR